jgi:aryl-alcohol dehydrogenase-like predicted oxidoreductase
MESNKQNMIYRYLGPTGLKVSVISYGNFVNSNTHENQKLTTDCIRRCLEFGVNTFDTAEGYGSGTAEVLMGNAFKELGVKREDIVVSTKIYFFGLGTKFENPNTKGLSRKHIIEGTKNCLKRLQLDYVDIIFAHRPDLQTPLEETCRAYSWFID